jgi:hypothetical protein
MVKYAESFTQNFELIAERKSVIYNLRELAKASVLAKFLLDSGIKLEETWFNLAPSTKMPCTTQIPQLWNERIRNLVEMKDGEILVTEASKQPKMHGIYGGVEFGLNKFNLTAAAQSRQAAVAAPVSLSKVPTGFARRSPLAMASLSGQPLIARQPMTTTSFARQPMTTASFARHPAVSLPRARVMGPVASIRTMAMQGKPLAPMPEAPVSAALEAKAAGYPAPQYGVPSPAMTPGARAVPGASTAVPPTDEQLQGVDLRLNNFDLSTARHVSLEVQEGSWGKLIKPLDDCTTFSSGFWSSLESDASTFKDGDVSLLQAIFNPCLSDRRSEGEHFKPPDASYSHVAKLRALIKEEEMVRQRRKEAFCRSSFSMSTPGRLFPESWTSEFKIENGQMQIGASEGRPLASLTERCEYQNAKAAEMLRIVLKSTVPVFEKVTEDGMRFCIYRLGSLEVRTFREVGCDESMGVVFSLQDRKPEHSSEVQVELEEKIVKATEYVERSVAGHRRYYIVLETENGHKVMTERREDGFITWEVDPNGLEERNSLAKVTRSKECRAGGTLCDLDALAGSIRQDSSVSPSVCKRWARTTYFKMVGK